MAAATTARDVRNFSDGGYVADLMAQLNRAAISQRVAQARKKAGLTQAELADLLHVHTKTVQNWESKTRPIVAYDRLDDVARATGVEWSWLLHGEPEEAAASAETTAALLLELRAAVDESAASTTEALAALARGIARIEELLDPGDSRPRRAGGQR